MSILEVKNLKKNFGSLEVLKGIDFSLEKGEALAMIGASGSGKTTLLRCLNFLERPTHGQIIVNDKVIFDADDNKSLGDAQIRKNRLHFGMVFQSFNLFPQYTALRNCTLARELMAKERPDFKENKKQILAEIQAEGEALLESVGLKEKMDFYPHQLSGGQRQRVAFARALAPNPQVLLLDEPFAAIDAKVRGELRTWLKELVEKLGITSIFVTHDQDEAVEVADEIIITNHGTIEQMGTPLEIYKSPDTPFVAQFIGHTTVVENYDRLKGFDRIENADKAVIRPEFIKISKSGNLDRYQSAAEEGIVTDVVFRGNRMDITVSINGIEVVGERSLEKDLIAVGEKVHVLIYRLYIFDEEKTYLMENSEMQEQDVFYI